MPDHPCPHIEAILEVQRPATPVCEECTRTGARWVHLRTCQECGRTHCCDSSANRHATAHFRSSGHPVIASSEAGERWMYCYRDGVFVEY